MAHPRRWHSADESPAQLSSMENSFKFENLTSMPVNLNSLYFSRYSSRYSSEMMLNISDLFHENRAKIHDFWH